jgi:hypothetical protein
VSTVTVAAAVRAASPVLAAMRWSARWRTCAATERIYAHISSAAAAASVSAYLKCLLI